MEGTLHSQVRVKYLVRFDFSVGPTFLLLGQCATGGIGTVLLGHVTHQRAPAATLSLRHVHRRHETRDTRHEKQTTNVWIHIIHSPTQTCLPGRPVSLLIRRVPNPTQFHSPSIGSCCKSRPFCASELPPVSPTHRLEISLHENPTRSHRPTRPEAARKQP